jgi:RimJ/RimL family protein N-acetyltransferase
MLFEIDNYKKQICENAIHYECYDGYKNVGCLELYTDYNSENKRGVKKEIEIYIEVYKNYQRKGYATEIYKSFLDKKENLGFINRKFVAYVLNEKIASIKLHKKLGFKLIKKYKKYVKFEIKDLYV